jgi:hypothetical protein
MYDIDESWDDDTMIDPEVWLRVLLAMTGDKERREKLVQGMSEKTGQPPERMEVALSAIMSYLASKVRAN